MLRSESVRLGHNKSAIFGALKHGCNPAPVHKKTQESDLCKKAGRDKFSSRASLLLPILPLVPNKEILTANEEIPTANEKNKVQQGKHDGQQGKPKNRKTPTGKHQQPTRKNLKPTRKNLKPTRKNLKPTIQNHS